MLYYRFFSHLKSVLNVSLEFNYFNKDSLGVSSGKLWLSWGWMRGGLDEEGRQTQRPSPETAVMLSEHSSRMPPGGSWLTGGSFAEAEAAKSEPQG